MSLASYPDYIEVQWNPVNSLAEGSNLYQNPGKTFTQRFGIHKALAEVSGYKLPEDLSYHYDDVKLAISKTTLCWLKLYNRN